MDDSMDDSERIAGMPVVRDDRLPPGVVLISPHGWPPDVPPGPGMTDWRENLRLLRLDMVGLEAPAARCVIEPID